MLKKELALALGISGGMVTKLAKRGMPTDDVVRAKRWRRRHLEPGRVKGNRMGTTAPPPPPQPKSRERAPASPAPEARPTNWLEMAAPDQVPLSVLEAVGAACAHLLEVIATAEDADYPLAFLRDLARRFDINSTRWPRFQLCVWLRLVDHFLHEEAAIRDEIDTGELLDIAEFGRLMNTTAFWPGEWWEAVCDWRGISVTGWTGGPKDDDEWDGPEDFRCEFAQPPPG